MLILKLEDLKEYCIMRERVRKSSGLGKSVTKLAFPQLNLKNNGWHNLLFDVFGDTDYEILVVKEKEEVELEIKDGHWDEKQGKIEFWLNRNSFSNSLTLNKNKKEVKK